MPSGAFIYEIFTIHHFFYCTFEAFTQPAFNRSYDFSERAALFGSVELSGDTVIVYGVGKAIDAPGFGILFARLDMFGNSIDYKIYNDSLEDEPTQIYSNSFIKLSDGSGYVGVGQFFYRANGYLIKFDNDGSLVFIKEFIDSTSGVDFFYQVKELPDGF